VFVGFDCQRSAWFLKNGIVGSDEEAGEIAHGWHMCYVQINQIRRCFMPQAPQEAMVRKPILMPRNLITKVDDIAKSRKVSFAEVVRDAVDVYDLDVTPAESKILEAMLDTAISSINNSIHKIEALEKRLDETHKMLEARRGPRG
jgi:hypothetical protein